MDLPRLYLKQNPARINLMRTTPGHTGGIAGNSFTINLFDVFGRFARGRSDNTGT